ncbi:diguanylate cyclase (GGDEF)-like protein [Pseudorhizobium tarimense]|uniref:Diguanylate cyclase (GGDEF)-like protein n=1 Tax=Pseudorhizobium tarimense TaxID=1079109 RepID=A0ABV2HC12_9HYPH|nr:EAL domain-containing protein [Pseudorhizobium tarimense]MCJ8521138.1 EAL domain-containing protein [Pseudorhizobium tarimense]
MTAFEGDEEMEAKEASSVPLPWHQSLFGKTAAFLMLAIVLAYCIGASAGWFMLQRDAHEQWRRQAAMNAQIATSTIRSIYTFVAVETDPLGQIQRIISERPIGDDQSVLETGFIPSDVLALAAAQTRHEIWLFGNSPAGERISLATARTNETGDLIRFDEEPELWSGIYQGFASIGEERHYVAALPVTKADGDVQGLIVTSIGQAEELLETQRQLLWRTIGALVAILIVTAGAVALLLRKALRPLPWLMASLTRIAHGDTSGTVPFQKRRDEIGRLATAIETLRAAVVERESLRQMKETSKQLEHLAHHDALTGLPNRAYFNKRLKQSVVASTAQGQRFNLLLIDLDKFKAANDSFGHAVGDALLVSVAERISLLLETEDFVARLGGDEFAIIQPIKTGSLPEASRLSKALIEALSTPFTILGHDVRIGASIGIAKIDSEISESDLLRLADVALYDAKAAGKGTYRFYKDGMVMAGANRYALERDIEKAIEQDELELHYQPIVRCKDEGVVGFEALIRWNHPGLGLVGPADFIPMAEETGQIIRIGRWVFERACRDAASLPSDLYVSINVSAHQLHQANFIDFLKEELQENTLAPARIEIELTESQSLSDPQINQAVHHLKALGVGISLDDFGTGHSTLANLLELPVDRIKIDRRFVRDIQNDWRKQAIVQGMVESAAMLDLCVTAEGVESLAQHLELVRLGCGFAQGFNYGRPRPLPLVLVSSPPGHPLQTANGTR